MAVRGRRVVGACVALSLGLGLSGCGDDEEAAAPPPATTTAPAAPTTPTTAAAVTTPAGDPAAFCRAIVAIDSDSAEPEIEETSTPAEIKKALAAYAKTFMPLVDEAVRTAPPEVADDVDLLAKLSVKGLAGDESVFESPAFRAADGRVDTYMQGACGYERIDVVATDYEYEGLPSTIPAGPVGVTLKNEGEEFHMLAVLRLKDGVELTADQLLALPEEKAMTMVEDAGTGFAGIGMSDTTFLDLEPGTYVVACFIPVGSKAGVEDAKGAPHFTEGMKGMFTVT